MNAMRRGSAGFTLIEVMIVVAIVAILARIAFPSYQESVARARRGDAKTVLLENAQFMERYYTQNNTYMSGTGNPTLPALRAPKDGTNKFYDVSFSGTNTATTYSIQAVPTGGMANDACGTLTLDQGGTKGVSGTKSVDDCWNR